LVVSRYFGRSGLYRLDVGDEGQDLAKHGPSASVKLGNPGASFAETGEEMG
jgi:hypothetical protein